ncbi:MAG: hypothetical protein ACTSVR_08370 [Candidatus Thorarchaeota archaeon]
MAKKISRKSLVRFRNRSKSNQFKAFLVQVLMERIYREYKVKSEGGTDSLGLKWKPLARSTIAQRPLKRGDISRFGIGGRGERAYKRRTRGLLTSSQDKVWRGIFASNFERLVGELGTAEAKARAATLAWAILKSRGVQTKLSILGDRKPLIMINTGRLLRSFAPGTVMGDTYIPPNGDQVVTVTPSGVRIDFRVPYGEAAMSERPVLPPGSSVWVEESIQEARMRNISQ